MTVRNQIRLLLLSLNLLANTAGAWPKPDAKSFLAQVIARYHELSRQGQTVPAIGVGQTDYVPVSALIRGQDKISVDNVYAKLKRLIDDGDLQWSKKKQKWIFNHDDGRSPVSRSKPIKVIKGPQGYVIDDGHHEWFIALFTGAEVIPIEVVEDHSRDMSPEKFWAYMKRRKLTLLKASAAQLAANPPAIDEISDYPNRYLASLLAAKIEAKVKSDKEKIKIKKVEGPDAPVWEKVNDSIPFVEFYLADALTEADIEYDPEWGDEVPPEKVEQARTALLRAQRSGKHPQLKNIHIYATREEAKKARAGGKYLKKALTERWKSPEGCPGLAGKMNPPKKQSPADQPQGSAENKK